MRRLLVLLVVLLPVSWFAVGCGAKGGGSSGPSTEPPSADKIEAMKRGQLEMMKKGAAPGTATQKR